MDGPRLRESGSMKTTRELGLGLRRARGSKGQRAAGSAKERPRTLNGCPPVPQEHKGDPETQVMGKGHSRDKCLPLLASTPSPGLATRPPSHSTSSPPERSPLCRSNPTLFSRPKSAVPPQGSIYSHTELTVLITFIV